MDYGAVNLSSSTAGDFPLASDGFGCDDDAAFAGNSTKGQNGHDTEEAYAHTVNFTACQ